MSRIHTMSRRSPRSRPGGRLPGAGRRDHLRGRGHRAGCPPGGVATGEVVFNTVLTGYQEVITDPSYAGQIIAFTYPHIGNYGVIPDDDESRRPFCRGVIVRDLARRPEQLASGGDLEAFLVRHRVPGLTGIDTRRLTRHCATTAPCRRLRTAASAATRRRRRDDPQGRRPGASPGTDGVDLVATVTTAAALHRRRRAPCAWWPTTSGSSGPSSATSGSMATVEVVPATTPAAEVLDRRPDGVFLSNGRATRPRSAGPADAITACSARCPIFGICLGHQLLATALGGQHLQAAFGHHGGNHPVRRLADRSRRDHQPEPQLRGGRQRRSGRPRSPTSTSTTA